MNKKSNELAKLILENPDLPIMAMVDKDVCPDDEYGYYLGEVSFAKVEKYLIYNDRVYTESEIDELEEEMDNDYFEKYSESLDAGCLKAAVAAMNWTRAIILYINIPEV